MSEVVLRAMRALIAEHGDGLFARPDLFERLLREAAPGRDEEVLLATAALADGVPGRLGPSFTAATAHREAESLAKRKGLRPDQALRAVEAWTAALRPAGDATAVSIPTVPLDGLTPTAARGPEAGVIPATRVWLGVRTGAGAGLLAGLAVVLLCCVATSLAGTDAAPWPIGIPIWLGISVVAGAAVAAVAVALRATQTPELLGCMAGAAAGFLGALLHAPAAAAMPGCADPAVREVSGVLLGVFICVIVGGGLGFFQAVIMAFLFKAAVYRRRSAFEVLMGIRRWNDEGLFDANQQEWNRRAGL